MKNKSRKIKIHFFLKPAAVCPSLGISAHAARKYVCDGRVITCQTTTVTFNKLKRERERSFLAPAYLRSSPRQRTSLLQLVFVLKSPVSQSVEKPQPEGFASEMLRKTSNLTTFAFHPDNAFPPHHHPTPPHPTSRSPSPREMLDVQLLDVRLVLQPDVVRGGTRRQPSA